MKIWYRSKFDFQPQLAEVRGRQVSIGRAERNHLTLDSHFVAEEAAILQTTSTENGNVNGWEVVVLGQNGCKLGDADLTVGQRARVQPGDTLTVFPFELTIGEVERGVDSGQLWRRQLDEQMASFIRQTHVDLLDVMDLGSADMHADDEGEYLVTLERNLEEIARLNGIVKPENSELQSHLAGYSARAELIEQLIDQSERERSSLLVANAPWARMVTAHPERESDLRQLAAQLRHSLELDALTDLSQQMDVIEERFFSEWNKRNEEIYDELRVYLALRRLKKEIKDIVFGYGPIEDLLQTPNISEIMVVSRDKIYIERNGVIENSGRQFISDQVTEVIINRIVSKVDRHIDKSTPLVDARLMDGSRVNAVIPPLAVSGPCLTIRKFPLSRMTIADLVSSGSMTNVVSKFLQAAVRCKKNILVSGSTGSGKTTLLNCLGEFIPSKERIITIEDTAELQLHKEHVVRMETKQKNAEGNGEYTIRDLVKNALRMRPDRIVVGECRGPEALDMLQAMTTGHDGSLTTVHADNAIEVISRLSMLVRQAGTELPDVMIRRQIVSAVDLVVQLKRMPNGQRKVVEVTELVEIDEVTTDVRARQLFRLEHCEDGLELRPTGRLPTFMGDLIRDGLLNLESFYR